MRTALASAFALLVAVAAALPAAAQVKMGDGNRVTQTGRINGAQIATAVGPMATAINGNASIISGKGGVTMGDGNRVTQDGRINGAQIATAVGPMATAINGNASIISGR